MKLTDNRWKRAVASAGSTSKLAAGSRTLHLMLLLPTLLGFNACASDSGRPDSEAAGECTGVIAAQECARLLASGEELTPWTDTGQDHPIVLYVDRSGSIKGFLDPDFPRQATDYRAVIDGLVVGLEADSAFSFGEHLRRAPLSNAALHSRHFYDDSDTRMEHAFARIASDSSAGASHVIVGDGRRGSTSAANGQYSDMRDLARRWIGSGGTFIVAASFAPFRPVPGDPAGCRLPDQQTGGRASCPLYAFAFVASGAEVEVGSALARAFEHVFAWPAAAIRADNLVLRPVPGGKVAVHPSWAKLRDGTSVARSSAAEHEAVPTVVRVELQDSASARGQLEAALLNGAKVRAEVSVRRLSHPPQPWSPVAATGSLVRVDQADPKTLGLISFGSSAAGYLYRIDIRGRGVPSWLDAFDATSATDSLRTFGLRWLFTGFESNSITAPPLGRLFIVAY